MQENPHNSATVFGSLENLASCYCGLRLNPPFPEESSLHAGGRKARAADMPAGADGPSLGKAIDHEVFTSREVCKA
jgi:hypothetical protein